MAYLFYYSSLILSLVIIVFVPFLKPIKTTTLVIAVATTGISLIFDILLGEYFDLYYYITPESSLLYMVVASVLLYPTCNIVYTLFLPREIPQTVMYTILWIGGMLLYEYTSITTGTVVLTGWRPFPWSVITYIGTYTWINFLYRYISGNKKLNAFN